MYLVYRTDNEALARTMLEAFDVDPSIAEVILAKAGEGAPYDVVRDENGLWCVRVRGFENLGSETCRKVFLASQGVELGYRLGRGL